MKRLLDVLVSLGLLIALAPVAMQITLNAIGNKINFRFSETALQVTHSEPPINGLAQELHVKQKGTVFGVIDLGP